MDGASKTAPVLQITLPLLAPVIFFNLVLQTIEAFKAFTQAFIVSGGTGGPIDATLFYTLYLYQEAFANFRMGYASALAWVLLVIIGIFTAIAFLTSKYWVYYEDVSILRRCARSASAGAPACASGASCAARWSSTRCLILASFGMLYPLLWMVASSFKPESEIFSDLEPLARAGRARQLRRGLVRAARELHDASSLELLPDRRPVGDRQPDGLLAHGLCLRAARVPPQVAVVRADAGHAHAALPRHAGAAIRAVPQHRLGRHHPAARRAEVPRGRRLLHLPDGAVLPRPAARAGRGGAHGRLRAVADLLADHPAARRCRCWRPPRSSRSSGPGTTSWAR